MSGKEIYVYRFFVTWNICNVFVLINDTFPHCWIFSCVSPLSKNALCPKIFHSHLPSQRWKYTRHAQHIQNFHFNTHKQGFDTLFKVHGKDTEQLMWSMFVIRCSIFQYQTKQTLDSQPWFLSELMVELMACILLKCWFGHHFVVIHITCNRSTYVIFAPFNYLRSFKT